VRGLSRLLGIELAVNFNLPYLSRTFSEFWNRWHISLSNWLRDYIYFPVSRLLRSRFPVSENIFNLLLPPVVTMLVSGLWHGATWGLLLWGAVHGLLLALENVLRVRGRHVPPDELPPFRQVIQTASVFIVVMLGWLPFRADLVAAKRYLAGMILPAHWLAPDWLRFNQVLAGDLPYEGVYGWNIPDPRILILLLVGIGLDLLQRRKQDELFFRSWPGWVQAIGLALVVLALILAGFSDTAAPFIYQGF
jgi:alginate O-acetyltransferase complex protein AlgI